MNSTKKEFMISLKLSTFQTLEKILATIKDTLNKAKLIRLDKSTNPALLSKPLKDALESGEYYYDPNSEFTTDTDVIVNDSSFKKISEYPINETPIKFVQ